MDVKTVELGRQPRRNNDWVYAYCPGEVCFVPTPALPATLSESAVPNAVCRAALHAFRGNTTVGLYKETLASSILPGDKEPCGPSPWALVQHSNVKCKTLAARSVLEKMDVDHVTAREWPAPSPDMSPLGNAWPVLLAAPNNSPPTALTALEQRLKAECMRLDQSNIENSLMNMSVRLKAVIKGKGSATTD